MMPVNSFKFWIPALACMVCQGLGMGLVGIYGFYVDPLAQEFDVSRATINFGPAFLLLMPALLGPFVGKLADRLPIRNLLVIGVLVSMGSLYAMSYADSFLLVTLLFIGFAAGFVFYGPIPINALLIKHYQERSGRALAIAAMGVSITTAVLPVLVAWLMKTHSWRESLSILAVNLLIILMATIFWGIGRVQRPAIAIDLPATSLAPVNIERGILRQQEFWLIGMVVAIAFSSSLVIAVCYPPHFISIGFTEMETGLLLTAGGAAGLAGKFFIAAFIDRFKARLKSIAVLLLFFQVAGYMGILVSETFYPVMLSIALAGFGGGAFIPMHPILNNNYFESKIIGSVSGAQVPMMLPLGLIGLPLSGYVFDVTGSYQPVIASVMLMFLLAIILLLKLPKSQLHG